jgi:hypothetical protein
MLQTHLDLVLRGLEVRAEPVAPVPPPARGGKKTPQ